MSRILSQLPSQLRQRLERCSADIAGLDLVLRGTLASYYTTCGKPGCRCQGEPPTLHGPYYQWTTKIEGKTHTLRLKKQHLPVYRHAIANGRRLDRLIARWLAASAAAADQIRKKPPR